MADRYQEREPVEYEASVMLRVRFRVKGDPKYVIDRGLTSRELVLGSSSPDIEILDYDVLRADRY